MLLSRAPRRLQHACLLALLVSGAAAQAGTGSSTLAVSAAILSKNNCRFNTNTFALDFGSIDPTLASARTVTSSVTFVCNGSADPATFFISAGDGIHSIATGARRLQNAGIPTEFLSYSLDWTPKSDTVGKGVNQTLTVTGTIQAPDFRNARPGAYADTVTITIFP